MNLKKSIACLLVTGMAVFGGNAFAAEQDLQAPVEILKTLQFTDSTSIEFGTVEAPDGVIETLIVSSNGDVSGTANALGGASQGTTIMSGEPNAVLTMSGVVEVCSNPSLFLSDFTFNNSTLNDDGDAFISHGATLTLDDVNSEVNTGNQSCTYTVTASY